VRKTNKTVPSFVGAGLEVLNEIEGDELSNKIANLKNQESEVINEIYKVIRLNLRTFWFQMLRVRS
jgi:flagellar motor switch protein FliG